MKQKISLVLSGGGARGIAHIGAIEELEKQGFEIKSIAGTSMGALVGGIYALGKMQEYKEWIYTLDKLEVFNLIDFSFSKHGLIKGDRVFKKMKEFIPDTNIENLKIPYAAIATDIAHNKEVVFTKGSLYEAIRASIAIPTVFTPVIKDKAVLVDGGVVNPIPLNRVKRTKGDILVAVHVNANIPLIKPPLTKENHDKKKSVYLKKIKNFQNKLSEIIPKSKNDKLGYFNLINKTTALMTYKISEMNLENYPPDILIKTSNKSCGIFDFYKAEELVEIGRYAAMDALNKYTVK